MFLSLLFSTMLCKPTACVLPERQSIVATVTAYTPLETCTSIETCIMANGQRVYDGAVACPRKYDFGTKVEILGKVYECTDRTAEKFDGRFDIFMFNHEEALTFGKRHVKVYVYETANN